MIYFDRNPFFVPPIPAHVDAPGFADLNRGRNAEYYLLSAPMRFAPSGNKQERVRVAEEHSVTQDFQEPVLTVVIGSRGMLVRSVGVRLVWFGLVGQGVCVCVCVCTFV